MRTLSLNKQCSFLIEQLSICVLISPVALDKHSRQSDSTLLNEVECRTIDWFCDGVKVLGLPRSIGEIYGLLFVAVQPLSLEDLVNKLGISKGSGSQGLNWLRTLGAVKVSEIKGSRKTFYEADVELKQLAAGFIKSQIRPHIHSGGEKLAALEQCADQVENSEERAFYRARVDKMDQWLKRGKLVIPILQKVLGG